MPNLAVADAERALGAGGRRAIANWVRNGGRYVGWRGGAGLAIRLGVSVAAQTAASSAVPGSLFRVRVDQESPLAQGVGATVWQHYQSDPLLRPGNPAQAAATYPPVASADWFVSGFERGASELAGTAAVTDEAVGQGRTVLFAGEPNFRAYTDGTARMLLNACSAVIPPAVSPRRRRARPRPWRRRTTGPRFASWSVDPTGLPPPPCCARSRRAGTSAAPAIG